MIRAFIEDCEVRKICSIAHFDKKILTTGDLNDENELITLL